MFGLRRRPNIVSTFRARWLHTATNSDRFCEFVYLVAHFQPQFLCNKRLLLIILWTFACIDFDENWLNHQIHVTV